MHAAVAARAELASSDAAAVAAVDAKLRSLAAILSRVAGPPPEEPGEPETRDEASRNPSPRNPSPASLEPPPAALRSAFLPRQTSIASPELCFPPPVATRVDAGTDVGPVGAAVPMIAVSPGRGGPSRDDSAAASASASASASADVVFSVGHEALREAMERCLATYSERLIAAVRESREGIGGSGDLARVEHFR